MYDAYSLDHKAFFCEGIEVRCEGERVETSFDSARSGNFSKGKRHESSKVSARFVR